MIEWGDITALLALIERLRARAAAALGFNVPILCCYEAGYEGFWVYRLMTAAGHRVLIIDPASPLVNRRAKRAKTDRIDAKTMVRALMAFNRGEHQVLSAVNEEMDGSEETMIASLARIRGVARMTHQCFSRSFLARIQESARNRRLERFRSDTVGERSCKQRSGHH